MALANVRAPRYCMNKQYRGARHGRSNAGARSRDRAQPAQPLRPEPLGGRGRWLVSGSTDDPGHRSPHRDRQDHHHPQQLSRPALRPFHQPLSRVRARLPVSRYKTLYVR